MPELNEEKGMATKPSLAPEAETPKKVVRKKKTSKKKDDDFEVLIPRVMHDSKRLTAIRNSLVESLKNNQTVSLDFVAEYNELAARLT